MIVCGGFMSLFSFSKSSFELKLAQKLQERFDKVSKRNQLLARWAFKKTSLPKNQREDYVYDIVKSYVFVPSDTRLIFNIVEDLRSRGIDISRDQVLEKLLAIEKKLKLVLYRLNNDAK